ncbi:MAG: LPS export ABC transporter periplasmic protein LptC [bacterium]
MNTYSLKTAIILLLSACYFVSCDNTSDLPRDGGRPNQVLKGFEVNHTNEGRLEWNLYADTAKIYEEQNIAFAEKPVIKFYDEGSLSSIMQSEHGKLYIESSNIEAWGNVVIHSHKEGSRLETNRAYYKADADKIISDELVRFYREDSITTGTGMESRADLSSIIIKNQKVEIRK